MPSAETRSRSPNDERRTTNGGGGAAGGGKDLERLGVIFAHRLPSQKARLTLMVAFGTTAGLEAIRNHFPVEA